MSGQSYVFTVDVRANIGNIKAALKGIQDELNKGNFSIDLSNSKTFLKTLEKASDLSSELFSKVGDQKNPNNLSLKEQATAIKDYEKLVGYLDTIKSKMQETYGQSFGKGLLDTAELKKATEAYKLLNQAREESQQKLLGKNGAEGNKDYLAEQERLLSLERQRSEVIRQRNQAETEYAKEMVALRKLGYESEDQARKKIEESSAQRWSEQQEARYQEIIKNSRQALSTKAYQKTGATDKTFTIGQLSGLNLESGNAAVKELKAMLSEMQSISKFPQGNLDNVNLKTAIDEVKNYRKELQGAKQDAELLKTLDRVEQAREKVSEGKKAEADYTKQIDAITNSLKNMEQGAVNITDLKKKLTDLGISGLDGVKSFSELETIISKLATTAQGSAKTSLENLAESIKKINDYSTQGRNSIPKMFDNLKVSERQIQDLQRLKFQVYNFFSMSNKIRLFRRILSDAFNTIKELDSVMTQTAVVTDFTVSDMWDKLPEYAERASELGTSISSLYEATTLYYQQGLGDKAAMDVGIETMKMARIANMDAADATEAMTAALRGFNMEINETSATRINDVYSELAAITAADTEQIATAMTKTASIASSANMEFETTAAFLAQIIETTQEAPETAGTAMKTIIARFTEVKELYSEGMLTGEDGEGEAIEINKIDKALQSVGISLKDFLLGKKGIDDIFLELASKWDTLDLATQRYIATTAAGSRQQSRFIAMMSDYGRTMELVNAAQSSEGASQEQFDKTLDSLDAKINRFKVAWDEFTMGILNSDLIKGFIDIGTRILEWVNNITKAFGKLGGVAKVAFAGLALSGMGKVVDKVFDPTGKIGSILAATTGRDVSQITAAMRGKQTLGQKLTQPLLQAGASKLAGSGMIKQGSVLSTWLGNMVGEATGEIVGDAVGKNIGKKTIKKVAKGTSKKFTGKIVNKTTGEVIGKVASGAVKEGSKEAAKKGLGSTLKSGAGKVLSKLDNGVKWTANGKVSAGIAGIGLLLAAGGSALEKAGANQGNEAAESWGTGIKSAGTTAAALGTVSAALAALGAAIPGANIIVAATAALVGLYKGLEKAAYLKSDEHALELAQANKKVAQETAVKEQERVKNMQSLTEGLSERYAEIDKMSRGSSEWKTAVAELNSEIANSIAEVPELSTAFKMEGGILRADMKKLDEISATVEDQAQVAETNLAIASHEETIAENNLEASNLFDEMFNGKWGKKWEDDGRKRSMMDQLLKAYREGRLSDMSDITAIVGSSVNKGYDYQDVILNINKYAANQAESAASQASLNQTMISSAQETGAISDTDAETLSGLSETFLNNIYQQSEAEAKENLKDWNYSERRDNRLEYARENNLKYKRGIWGLWSKFKDENGNVVSVTDDMIRSEEINASKQTSFNQRAQQMSSLLTENPLLAHAMSVGGERLTSTDLDKMSGMFIEGSEGERIFDAQAFAESFGQDAMGLASLAGFEGKEEEFFGQIFENFRQRVEKRIQTAADAVEMGNVLGFSQRTMDALNSEELQSQALDFYNQMQLRGLDTDAMRTSMEVFGQLAEIGDQHGLEQLSTLVDKINFNNPIEAFKQLQKAADKGTYAEKQYANAVLSSGSQIISTGAQLQHFLRSEDFDTVWEELEGIIELNKTVEPDDVLNLAESYDVLNDIMDQTGIGAVGLAKAMEMVGEGLMSADSMTDAVIAALSAMDSVGEEISRGLINASKFDPGQDENQAVGFISQAYEALNANIEKGAWGNSQNVAYLDELFGTSWRSDDAEVQTQNMKELTKFLGKNAENMSNAWRMAAKGETFFGGDKSALDALGLTLDPSTGEVRMGDQVASMNSEQIVDALSTGFGVSEQMARLMLADFKNYSKDFDLLLGIAKNDEKEGAERFGKTADKRTEDFDIGENKYKGTIDKAELQAAGIAAGYTDKEGKTAGEQYWEENREEITGGESYLITDYYYEDGSRKGGKDLSQAVGDAYLSTQDSKIPDGAINENAIGAAFYTSGAARTVTGTWEQYINEAYASGSPDGLLRTQEALAAQQAVNMANEALDMGIYATPVGINPQNGRTYETWDAYLNGDIASTSPEEQARRQAEYDAWVAQQEAIIAENSQASWTEYDKAGFDYEGMINMIETLGATSDEAAMIAQSQIDAQLEATGQQSANLKMWSDVLGDEVAINHQRGENIQQEFQAAEAQAKQQQQIATLREALGMGEDGVLKVAIEGLDAEGQTSIVTFEPDEASVAATLGQVKSTTCSVHFQGSATVSPGGTTYTVKSQYASGIVDAPNTHDALLGEKGPELVQTKKGAWIAGLNGPEIGTIHKGDTVYTAEETKRIFNPKKNSMPRFEDGTGPGPGAYSNVTSGGKGRGGDDKAEVENPFDKLYNLLRKIDEELRERERIERRYEKLLEDLGVSANKIIDISREELLQLEKERKLQEKLIEGRREQIKLYQEEKAELTKYANVTQNERGEDVLRIDWDLIDTVDNKEEMSDIEEYVRQLEEWFDSLAEAEDALWQIEDAIEEIKERGEDEYFDLEEAIKDALEQSYQDQIDKLEDINDAINDTNAELLEGIQKSIEKTRQDRENEKTEEKLSDKQRRLSYLQMDTSGSNATEILALQKELEEEQENYTDTLIDQKISELQEQNDEAAKQREKQIDLLQAQLDHYLETGRIWNEVYQLMDDGLDKDNGLVRGSRLEEILKNEENFAGLSAIGKQEWWVDMDKKVASALAYLEVGRQIENLGVKNKEIEFYTEDGKKLKGKVDDKGNVTTADGTMYNNVYQGANGLYYAGKNYETPKEPKVEGVGKGTSGSGSGSGNGSGSGSGQNKGGKMWTATYNGVVYYSSVSQQDALSKAYNKRYEDAKDVGVGTMFDNSPETNLRAAVLQRPVTPTGFYYYETGGLADFTGPAWLDGTKSRPELVLNQRDTQNFIQLKDILSSLFSHDLGNSTSTENNGDITYDIDINVESIGSDYDVDKVASRVKTLITEDARYRNNNVIGLKR